MSSKCAAFWHHTNLRSDNRIFPCCRYKESVMTFNGDLSSILDSEVYADLRTKVTNGEYLPGCSKCYKEEQYGTKSLREKFNEEYDTDSVSLDFFEVGFDNICNLTCDGCSSEFSHSWAKKDNPTQPIKLLIKQTNEITNIPSSLKKVLFLGGEPLMTNRHKTFLKNFNNLENLEVVYNTNGTFLLDQETIDLLNAVKEVKFIVSIDGIGPLQEKVRPGCNWDDILTFIDQLIQLNFKFSIHSVMHINNWFGFDELAKFVEKNNYNWTTNVLTYPESLSIRNFSNKEQLSSYIQGIDIPNKYLILNYLKS
jgi:sulfatase maturation enzyme AslB (radical SAM superfamily)